MPHPAKELRQRRLLHVSPASRSKATIQSSSVGGPATKPDQRTGSHEEDELMRASGTDEGKMHGDAHPAVAALLAAPMLRRESLAMSAVRAVGVLGVLVLLLVVTAGMHAVQLLALPLAFADPQAWHELNSSLFGMQARMLRLVFEDMSRVNVTFSGFDAVAKGQSSIVIGNHVFYGDVLPYTGLAHRLGMARYARCYMKHTYAYMPVFGWFFYLAGVIFLATNWKTDEARIRAAMARMARHALPMHLGMMVEGHVRRPRHIAACREYAAANADVPRLEHLLVPRYKGFAATLRAARAAPHVSTLYDATLATWHRERGFGAQPTYAELMTGRLGDYRFHVHVEQLALGDIPDDDEGAKRFLYDLFAKKDALLRDLSDAFTLLSC